MNEDAERLLVECAKLEDTVDLGDVVIKENETYDLTERNVKFTSLTLHSGSTLNLLDDGRVAVPIRLDIDHLIIEPGNTPAIVSINPSNPVTGDGDNGKTGRHGRHGYRRNDWDRTAVEPWVGGSGWKGENGKSYTGSGVLYAQISKLSVTNGLSLSQSYLVINGLGQRGGNGGNGGRGGNGGNGAPGVTGKHSCGAYRCRCVRQIQSGTKGANSGEGGYAGHGGHGGRGAYVLIAATAEIYSDIKAVANLAGGPGGKGAIGGRPGRPGKGASKVGGGGGHCGNSHDAMPDGKPGADYTTDIGADGSNGPDGSIRRRRDLPRYSEMLREMPEVWAETFGFEQEEQEEQEEQQEQNRDSAPVS